jgi:hypothetical protein
VGLYQFPRGEPSDSVPVVHFRPKYRRPSPIHEANVGPVVRRAIFNVTARLGRTRVQIADKQETPVALGSELFIPGTKVNPASENAVPLRFQFSEPVSDVAYWGLLVTRDA